MDSVVSVKKYCGRVLFLKMVLDNGLLNVPTVFAPHSGKPDSQLVNLTGAGFVKTNPARDKSVVCEMKVI